ncbi:MAG: FAD-dependent oxidoreductase [Nanoarchaeota archaeon]|nr:FAD-dependent oxidoreductase [Nanoarchaeota archaeon]
MENLPIIVVGGGISGLIAAEKLAENNVKVILFEQGAQLGGLAKSLYYKQKWLPITYHHIMAVDDYSYKWLKKYGLTEDINWKKVYMGFWYDFKPYLLTLPHHIAFFSPLSIIARLKLIKLGLYTLLKKRLSLENISAEEWLNKSYGKDIVKNLFKPLAEIKFGELSSVSASWLASRLHEAVRTREKYAHFPCKSFIDKISKNITKNGGRVYLNTEVCEIKGNKIEISLNGKKKKFIAKKIISAIPPPKLAKILDIEDNIKKQLQTVGYIPVISAMVSCKDLFLKSYWNIFIKPKLSFGGIFSHSFICPDLIKGEHIYYIFTYMQPTNPLYNQSKKTIKDAYLRDIKKINPNINIKFLNISKIKHASPVFCLDYKNLPIKLSQYLYLTGVYKEYPTTRTINSAIKSGLKTADHILNEK